MMSTCKAASNCWIPLQGALRLRCRRAVQCLPEDYRSVSLPVSSGILLCRRCASDRHLDCRYHGPPEACRGERAKALRREMNEPTPDIGEDDLHAYVDNQLPASRCKAVQDYLAQHPEEARRVAAYRRQKEAIRKAMAAALAEVQPPRLTIAGILAERRSPRRTPF